LRPSAERVTVSKAGPTKTLLLVLVSTIVSLLLGIEIAAYLTVPAIAMSSEGDGIVIYDPEVGAIPNPSSHTKRIYPAIKDRKAFTFDVYTDDRGARVDGPGQRSPARVDILTVGGSFTWGYALENRDTYSSGLGRNFKASVSNFGMASYGTTQSLQMLRRNRDLAPRLVVYGIIAHHFERNVMPCAPSYYPFCLDVSHVVWNDRGEPRIAPPWSNGVRRLQQQLSGDYSNPVSWLTHGLDVIQGRIEYARAVLHEADEAEKDRAMTFLLRELERTTTEIGAQLLVVYIPTNYWGPPAGLARAIGNIRLLDLTESFRRNKEEGGPNLYIVGDGHPSAAAHALIADEIAKYVRREKLL
jgi:hypothetical protein